MPDSVPDQGEPALRQAQESGDVLEANRLLKDAYDTDVRGLLAHARGDFGAGLASPSDDGGLDEFREFWPSRARRPATSAASAST